ncbi:TonB-dependent receptor [Hymenobacter terrestris]|uniref:TonB-dependent receptor n=1 Tax=Hymenobacter terrestris TaxID=2748310 RepID=A0ABX2Q202_9BACT|nr:TonB-dependent receptor [Hymenobacter terrestris]NVO84983.1 TonB-dependent receptor [Hymenobacter terrestris]
MSRLLLLLLLLFTLPALGQNLTLSGRVTDARTGRPVAQAEVLLTNSGQLTRTDAQGRYQFGELPAGTYALTAFAEQFTSITKPVELTADATLDFALAPSDVKLSEVNVEGQREQGFGIRRLNSVEGTAIYEAKKTEVIELENVTANLATNNARQVFAKVAGLNIWESDGAGIQLGIGGRGLSPNRTANFNTRQNGYDISADALGYPESYYTPPTEALDRIEVVRGAASLQYGTQFGGMLNFVLRQGPTDKKVQFTTRQTGGSFGFFNSFNSVGGQLGRTNYYAYYQYKRGDGWRPNSGFDVHTAYASVQHAATEKFKIGLDYTRMYYLAQQPGGLTDAEFAQDARQSKRTRNWFRVNWNLLAATADYRFSDATRLNWRTFGLLADRTALGNLSRIDRPDDLNSIRLLLRDEFRNVGSELRLLHRYALGGSFSTLLVGGRYYHGFTDQRQGPGSRAADADFTFYPAEQNVSIVQAAYKYPSRNASVFVENIFNLTPRLSLTPGLRYEFIRTKAGGTFAREEYDQAGNFLSEEKFAEQRQNTRGLLLGGLGASFKPTEQAEVYANFSQNYRAINFNDMRVVNPGIRVDQGLLDERGYSADLGLRGGRPGVFTYDASLFYLAYKNRIGLLPVDGYLLRTNIGRSRNLGLETFVETDILRLLQGENARTGLSVFSNLTLVDARYNIDRAVFRDKKVELAPSLIAKAGLTLRRGPLKLAYQYAYTSRQFTDATNSVLESTAVFGEIPAYWIMDLSGSYEYKFLKLEAGLNNLTDNRYFTRRATAYPGPGIIPADARGFYVTLQAQF